MKLGWGTGEVVVALVSLAAYLFGLQANYSFAAFLVLTGLWTLATGILFADRKDRNYYVAWGVVIAIFSTFIFLPPQYTLGLVLVAIVALILLTAFTYRSGKSFTAATQPSQSPAGGTPAAQ